MGAAGWAAGAPAGVAAGAGVAWNHAEVNSPVAAPVPTGTNVSAAAAVMAGVGYDMGNWVADVGYRGVYINQINNSPTTDPDQYYEIDGSLIRILGRHDADAALVRAIVQMAQTLGLKTIAEYVETSEIAAQLREIGVDYGQGFGLHKPEPLSAMKKCASL